MTKREREDEVSARPVRPIGPQVIGGAARRPDKDTQLAGRFVTLVPLKASSYVDDLFDGAGGEPNKWLYDYMPHGPYYDRESFRDNIRRREESAEAVYFAIVDNRTSKAVGHASLMRIDAANGVIETGDILYLPVLQQKPGATESMYLLARHVFDELGYRRYEWKCDALNKWSRRAAERLGFTFEGVFRQHMIVRGHNRDTAWLAMLDTEWPAVRNGFERWLSPANFDDDGHQRASLASLRTADV